MIIRVDVFKMPILHAKSLWDYAKLDKAQSFIEVSCMDVGCVCKTQCSWKWRSLRIFMQADFHARQKKAHKNMRVNCNQVYVFGSLFSRSACEFTGNILQ